MLFHYVCKGNISFCVQQHIFLHRSQGDSVQMNVLSSYLSHFLNSQTIQS